MKQIIKHILFDTLCLIVSLFLFLPAGAAEDNDSKSVTIQGTIQGFNCISMGKTCPVGAEDPLIETERLFVLYTKEGHYYLIPNLDRAIMARHINEIVRFTGPAFKKFNSMQAEKLEVLKDGVWRTTWPVKGWKWTIEKERSQ